MFGYGKINVDNRHRVRKADICFVFTILAVAFVSFLIIKLQSETGSYAVISYDGAALLSQISFEQPEPLYYLLTYENSDSPDSNNTDNSITMRELSATEWEAIELPNAEYNVFICADHEIRMLQSSCPDKICVHHSAISNIGENIICLPHKLVIEIKSGKENDLDGVAY